MRHWLATAVLALPMLAITPFAYAAGFENAVLSAEKDAMESVTSFAPDTPVIYLAADLVDVANGAKVSVSWVSVDSHGAAPPNFTIATVDVPIDNGQDKLTSDLSKPTNGWPIGTYRVDITIDGTVAEAAAFEVK